MRRRYPEERAMCPNASVRKGLILIVVGLCAGLLFGLVSGTGSGVASELSESEEPSQMVDSGSWYVRYRWPHDGHPYESQHLRVYSDTSSQEARVALAELGERLLAETIAEMGISSADLFRFPPGQDKIDIYAFKDRPKQDWGGRAYYGGLLIHAIDHEGFLGPQEPDKYGAHLKHELVHVVESLLKGRGSERGPWVAVWFSEGLAETMSGGAASRGINGLDHLDSLTAEFGSLNPVSYQSDGQVCTIIDAVCLKAYSEYHYPTWYLAVEYLLDEGGLGRTASDAAAVFVDMSDGATFQTAFDDHMGITLSEYEEQFFERMAGYLPESSTSVAYGPLGLALISVIAVGIAGAASIWSVRRSLATAGTEGASGAPARTGWSRIGFTAWITAISVPSLGLFLLGVYSLGGSWEFTNADKTFGVAVFITYLGVCAVILTWAIRSWVRRSLTAWLVPLLAIGAAAATVAVINQNF
jgi:hypothetical protein